MPLGGFGGDPGSQQKDIKYAGTTQLTAATTETGKAYESTKTDECALLIDTKEAVTIAQPSVNKTGDSDGGSGLVVSAASQPTLQSGGTVSGGSSVSLSSYSGGSGIGGGPGGGGPGWH